MNNNKGSVVLLTILGVATLLVAVVGATFAYFSATMNGTESEATIEVTSGTLSTEYGDNSKLNLTGGEFGSVLATKTLTVSGIISGSTNLNYEIDMSIKNNTYAEGDLVYVIESSNESVNGNVIANSEEIKIPAGASTIELGKGLFAGPITSGATHSYTITIKYVGEIPGVEKGLEGIITVSQSKK